MPPITAFRLQVSLTHLSLTSTEKSFVILCIIRSYPHGLCGRANNAN